MGTCLLSAVCFGALPILAKVALDAGASPLGLLWMRFCLAALVFWCLLARQRFGGRPATPRRRAAPRMLDAPPRRAVAAGFLMGMCGYALEAALFFLALDRIDAGLTELLLYAYPALVTLAAVTRGAERATPRLVGALGLGTAGLMLVFGSSLASGADPVGLALGLGAAVVYAAYILCGERVGRAVAPLTLATLVSTGAAVAFTLAGLAGAELRLPTGAGGHGAVVALAVGATVVPMVALFAGIRQVGASTASIVSTLEPVVTVALAAVLLGEHLGPAMAAGAACVLAAVAALRAAPAPASGGTVRRPVPGAGCGWPSSAAIRRDRGRSPAPAPAPIPRPVAAATPGPRRPG